MPDKPKPSNNQSIKVFVGMSGGVDSSVTAAILKEQGYQVCGVYMKNWSKDLPGFHCPWQEDYQDAKRVAVQLGIPFQLFDFETEYREMVVNYMLEGYMKGITPNPDIMCNQEIKFKLFLSTALDAGADMIATGHYARVTAQNNHAELHTGLDSNKDQSYFLYRVTEDALRKTLMPIGDLEKPKVRELARSLGLKTADKKDSQGICFVGKIGIKEFLLAELGAQSHGPIIDQNSQVIGEHDGALFYTIGQRHGLNVGGGLPYYVTSKNMANNEVYVTNVLTDSNLWTRRIVLTALHWIDPSFVPASDGQYTVRTRYRATLVACRLKMSDTTAAIELDDDVRAVTPGQSAVLYDGDKVLGGGIVVAAS